MASERVGEPMSVVGKFATAIYLIALLCMVAPPLDLLLSLPSIDVANIRWRFGALGLLTGATIFPLLGLLLALVTSAVARHRFLFRFLMVLVVIGIAGLTVVLGLFTLDAVQIRREFPAEASRRFDVSVIKQILLQLFQISTLVVLLRASLRANRALSPARAEDTGLLMPNTIAAARAEGSRPVEMMAQ